MSGKFLLSQNMKALAIIGVHIAGSALAATPETNGKLAMEDHASKSVTVKAFNLVKFKPRPDLGWTKERVAQFLEAQIEKKNGQFTTQELDVVARQLSIQMKQAGLMFSRARVLQQEITDQSVDITFEDGVLGEVVVMDADRTKPKVLARPFMPYLQNTAVRSELDEALYRLDRLAGVNVFGFFSLTDTPGLSRLNLRVVEEQSYRVMFNTDNYGSESTGRERAHATLELLNVSGWGDELKLNAGRSYSQPGFFEGYIQYTYPIGQKFQPLRFLLSNSDFELGQGFESLDVFGESTLARVQYETSSSLNTGSLTHSFGLSASKSRIDSLFYSNLFFRDGTVAAADIKTRYAMALNDHSSQSFALSLRAGRGEETRTDEESNEVTDERSFTLFSAEYGVQFLQDKASTHLSTLDIRLFGSSDPLPSVEQIGFGGKYGVKGLPSGYFSADSGLKAHFRHDIGFWPSNWPGTLSFLSDAGFGQRNEINNSSFSSAEQTAQFFSLGLGYSWRKGPFTFSYDFGKVVHADLDAQIDAQTIKEFNSFKPSRHYLSFSYDWGER